MPVYRLQFTAFGAGADVRKVAFRKNDSARIWRFNKNVFPVGFRCLTHPKAGPASDFVMDWNLNVATSNLLQMSYSTQSSDESGPLDPSSCLLKSR